MQDTDSEVERVEHRRKIYSIAALGVLAVVVIAGVSTFFVIRNWQTTGAGPNIDNSQSTGPTQNSPSDIRLYFIAENGLGLVE